MGTVVGLLTIEDIGLELERIGQALTRTAPGFSPAEVAEILGSVAARLEAMAVHLAIAHGAAGLGFATSGGRTESAKPTVRMRPIRK